VANQDPIGHHDRVREHGWRHAFADHCRDRGDTHEYASIAAASAVYVNLCQRPRAAITLTMLSDADFAVGDIAARGIPAGPHPEIRRGSGRSRRSILLSLGSRIFHVMLIGFFGITALLLATAGCLA